MSSTSSPADLAVAFHSLPRRLAEARGDAPDDVVAMPLSEYARGLAAAARLLGCVDDPHAIAEAITHVPADRWDDAVLDELRDIALDAGRLLRDIERLAHG